MTLSWLHSKIRYQKLPKVLKILFVWMLFTIAEWGICCYTKYFSAWKCLLHHQKQVQKQKKHSWNFRITLNGKNMNIFIECVFWHASFIFFNHFSQHIFNRTKSFNLKALEYRFLWISLELFHVHIIESFVQNYIRVTQKRNLTNRFFQDVLDFFFTFC